MGSEMCIRDRYKAGYFTKSLPVQTSTESDFWELSKLFVGADPNSNPFSSYRRRGRGGFSADASGAGSAPRQETPTPTMVEESPANGDDPPKERRSRLGAWSANSASSTPSEPVVVPAAPQETAPAKGRGSRFASSFGQQPPPQAHPSSLLQQQAPTLPAPPHSQPSGPEDRDLGPGFFDNLSIADDSLGGLEDLSLIHI